MSPRLCRECNRPFEVDDADQAFYDKISPVLDGDIHPLPSPSLCPDHRKRRRLAFRNERHLYHRKCDLTGKNIVSVYSPDKPLKAFHTDAWWGDSWSAEDTAREIDFSRPFFEQFKELLFNTPLEALFIRSSENSEYTNLAGFNKNCYLVFNSPRNEDCMYARGMGDCRTCLDMYFCTQCELCYECINCHNCYNLRFSENCSQCMDSSFLFNCTSCANCFACTNLTHKEYHFLNKALTKAEYEEQVTKLSSSHLALEEAAELFSGLKLNSVHRANQNINSSNCTGDYLSSCENCQNCYEVHEAVGCRYCDSIKPSKDIYDAIGFCLDAELMYETLASGMSQRIVFCFNCSQLYACLYSAFCHSSKRLFGCVGLKHKENCILNKSYSPDQYDTLASKLAKHMMSTGEWGEFFSGFVSPYGYNESVAQEYYPLSRKEAEELGYGWTDYIAPTPEAKRSISAKELPGTIDIVSDDITQAAIICEKSGKVFRILKQELQFYRNQNLPLPHLHPDIRHTRRMALRNPHHLWKRVCDKCKSQMHSSYSPERPEKVYCEACYRGKFL